VSRRVVVIVPLSPGDAREEQRVLASFAFTSGGGAPVVERAGTLAAIPDGTEEDALVAGFAAACAHASRAVPDALRVRASSHAPIRHARDIVPALTVVGAVAANALLTLGFGDEDLTRIAVRAAGCDIDGVSAALSGHRVTVHYDCDGGAESIATDPVIAR
jgi:hypothetical protein